MSVRIPRWFGFPPELIDNGQVASMSESDLRLCLYLYGKSDRCSSRRFEAKDKDITCKVGISQRSLRDARKHLVQFGIIAIERESGGCFVYTLCDPKTGQPYPGDPKLIVQYSGKKAQNASPSVGWNYQPTTTLAGVDDEDTSFRFGHNLSDSVSNPTEYNPFL